MKRQRAFGPTELLIATSFLTFAVVTACGGADDSSGGSSGSGGVIGGMGGVSGKAGGSAGKGGTSGRGGSGGNGVAGDETPDAGNAGGSPENAGGEGGQLDTSLMQPLYPTVKFPKENTDSPAKDMLGKILFWDEQVGSDNTQACGTCHRTGSGGGSDPRTAAAEFRNPGDDGVFNTADDIHGSQGIRYCTSADSPTVVYDPTATPFKALHQVTNRKAPSYLDAMFAPNIFWDGRATSEFDDPISAAPLIASGGGLESQSVGPPMNAGEMACQGRTWATLLAKLGTVVPLSVATEVPPDMKVAIAAAGPSGYSALFKAAFDADGVSDPTPITAARFAFAIATHERHLTSNQTPWDRYNAYLHDPKTGDRNAMTAKQIHGFDLFMNKASCGTCHLPPLFTDFQFHNLGFITEKDLGTKGTKNHGGDPVGEVKTAGLRNVGLRESQGLFHYGFGPGQSLESVLVTYNNPPNKVDPTAGGLDPTGSAIKPLGLTEDEIADIIDFLRNGLTDPRVKNQEYPFDKPTLSTE